MPYKKDTLEKIETIQLPLTYDEMVSEITNKYDSLSKKLKQIANFVLDNPNDVAIDTIAILSDKAEVQPSALIRFAQAFGFSGFSDIQRLFQQRLIESRPSYAERLASIRDDADINPYKLMDNFIQANLLSLEHLREEIDPEKLSNAIKMLKKAKVIHVMGMRRSFALATHFFYAVTTMGKRVCLVDNFGGLAHEQQLNITEEDALIAISFLNYTPETIHAAERAVQNNIPVIGITDHPLSPLTKHSTICFNVEDNAVHGFRSSSASMCLVQTLAIGVCADS